MTIRLHLRRWQFKFLGLFREVRELRSMESRKDASLTECHRDIRHGEVLIKSAEIELAHLNAQLEETKRGLATMTESRLNADRQIELLRGELNGIREISAREIHGMQQTVDCFALQTIGRQVFGTAPLTVRAKEEDEPASPRGMSIRDAQRRELQAFYDEVEKRGMTPPPQPEYSSKNGAQPV